MKCEEITVTNPTLRRKWGWGFATQPLPNSTIIPAPEQPCYIGTLSQIRDYIQQDRAYRNLRHGGTWITTQWFYDGRPIHTIEWLGGWTPFATAFYEGIFDPEVGFPRYREQVTLRVIVDEKERGE